MTPEEVTQKAFDAIEKHDIGTLTELLDNNFQFIGPVPMPLKKDQFITLMQGLTRGAPDWNFNRTKTETKGDIAYVTVGITGTHTGELALPIPGVGTIPPTGKKFRIPQEVIEVTVKNDKISKINVPPVPHGGIPGMLEQIGHPIGF